MIFKIRISGSILSLLLCTLLIVAGCTAEAKKERHSKKGEKYLSESRYREAVIEFKNVLKYAPEDAGARLKLGLAHLRSGEFREAYAQFLKSVQLDPGLTEARIQLGRLYLMSREIGKAKEQARAVLEKFPSEAKGHMLMSMVHLAERDREKAYSESVKAVECAPQNSEARLHLASVLFMRRDLPGAEREIKKAIEIEPASLPARNSLAGLYLIMRRFDLAEAALIQATSLNPENQEAALHLADFYINVNQPEKGAAIFKKALEKNPDNTQMLARMAELSLNRKDLQAGVDYTEKILKINPKSSDGQLLKGRIHLLKNEYSEAIIFLQAFVKDHPKSAAAHHFLGLAHLGSNSQQQAKFHFSEAVRLKPGWTEPRLVLAEMHLASGSLDQAESEVRTVLKASPADLRAQLIQGSIYLKAGTPQKAEKVFTSAIRDAAARSVSPDPRFYLGLAQSLLSQNRSQEALSTLEDSLRVHPDYSEPLRTITALHIKNKSFNKAAERVELYSKAHPDDPMPLILLGQITESAGNPSRSEFFYKEAVRIGRTSQFFDLLAGFYIRSGRLDSAEKELTESLRLTPKSYQAHMGLALIYENRKESARAVDHYRKALDVNPGSPAAANNLAYLYAERDENLDTAMSLAAKARETAPQDPFISDTLGWIYYKKNFAAKAIPYLRDAVQKIPDKAVFHYHLGLAYQKNGEKGPAEKEFRKAIEIEPNFSERDKIALLLADLKKRAP